MGVIAIRVSDDLETKIKQVATEEKTNVSQLCKRLIENNINIENPLKVLPQNWDYITAKINDLPQDISPDEYHEIDDEVKSYNNTIKALWKQKVNRALDLLESKLTPENRDKEVHPLDRLVNGL